MAYFDEWDDLISLLCSSLYVDKANYEEAQDEEGSEIEIKSLTYIKDFDMIEYRNELYC